MVKRDEYFVEIEVLCGALVQSVDIVTRGRQAVVILRDGRQVSLPWP